MYYDGKEVFGNSVCPFCSKKQKSLHIWDAPWKDHKPPESCVMECEFCQKKFVTENTLATISYAYLDDDGNQRTEDIENEIKRNGLVTKESVEEYRKKIDQMIDDLNKR